MNSSQYTILADLRKLASLETLLRFKSSAYADEQPALAETLSEIAGHLKRAYEYMIKDISSAMNNTDKSFRQTVRSSALPGSLYLKPMETAEKLSARVSAPAVDAQLCGVPREVTVIYQCLRLYHRHRAREIDKLLVNKTATMVFLMAHLEEL